MCWQRARSSEPCMHSSGGATSSWSMVFPQGDKDFPRQAETNQLVTLHGGHLWHGLLGVGLQRLFRGPCTSSWIQSPLWTLGFFPAPAMNSVRGFWPPLWLPTDSVPPRREGSSAVGEPT